MAPAIVKTIHIGDLMSPEDRDRLEEFDIRNGDDFFGFGCPNGLWDCLVKAPNGKLYGPPSLGSRLLCINPETEQVSLIGDEIENCDETSEDDGDTIIKPRYMHAVLANNGCIYAVPCGSQHILKIDPITDAILFIPYPKLRGTRKCILGLDGHVYFIDHGQVFQINTSTDTVTAFGRRFESNADRDELEVDVVASNGKIVARSDTSPHRYAVIDPSSGTVLRLQLTSVNTEVPANRRDDWDRPGFGVCGPRGMIHFVAPYWMYIIDPTTNIMTLEPNPFGLQRLISDDESLVTQPHPRAILRDGRIFEAIGESLFRLVKYDLENMTLRRLGHVPMDNVFTPIIVGKDDCAYVIPLFVNREWTRVIVADATCTEDLILSQIGPLFHDECLGWCNGLLAGNGQIYCLPNGTNEDLLVIDTSRWVRNVGEHILLRCLVDTGRAQLKNGFSIVGKKRKRAGKLVTSETLRLLEFIFAESPQGVFASILSFL